MGRRQGLKLMACGVVAVALAVAPVASAARAADAGAYRALLCAEGTQRFIEIGFGGDAPEDNGSHAPCHAACLTDRKPAKPRSLR